MSLDKVGLSAVPTLDKMLALTGNAAVTDVRSGKTFYNTNPNTKNTGTADLAEHQNAETDTALTASNVGATAYWTQFANGATTLSCSITTTKRCCIVVVAAFPNDNNVKKTDIERGGVVKTVETTLSAVNFAANTLYGHLQYATEILDAGTYQYDIVNTSGGSLKIFGAMLKIVAVKFE